MADWSGRLTKSPALISCVDRGQSAMARRARRVFGISRPFAPGAGAPWAHHPPRPSLGARYRTRVPDWPAVEKGGRWLAVVGDLLPPPPPPFDSTAVPVARLDERRPKFDGPPKLASALPPTARPAPPRPLDRRPSHPHQHPLPPSNAPPRWPLPCSSPGWPGPATSTRSSLARASSCLCSRTEVSRRGSAAATRAAAACPNPPSSPTRPTAG